MKTGKIATTILTILLVSGGLFIGLMILTIGFMGDRNCRIQIQNGGQGDLILKTFQFTNYDKKLTVDSNCFRKK